MFVELAAVNVSQVRLIEIAPINLKRRLYDLVIINAFTGLVVADWI
jgi:hypothetical protein